MDQFIEDFDRNQIGQEADNPLMDALSLMYDDSIHHVHEPSVSISGQEIAGRSTLELDDIVHNILYSDTETTDHVTQQAQHNDVTILVSPTESCMVSWEDANTSAIDNSSSTCSSSNGYAANASLDRFTYQFAIEPIHAMKENEFQVHLTQSKYTSGYYYYTANIIDITNNTKIDSRQFNSPIYQDKLLQLLLMSQLPN